MITRSNAKPTAPATAIATSIAGSTASKLRIRCSLAVQSPMRPSTEIARYAPSAMNTPWPKLSTSISPNTSVRPEAMMNMIMPIASPATVSVTQVENEPISGSAASASAGTSNSGSRSSLTAGSASKTGAVAAEELIGVPSSLMGRERQAEQALLQTFVIGEFGHGAGVHDTAAVHHRYAVSELARKIEILFNQQDGAVGLFEFTERRNHVLNDGRRQALARFIDQ